MKIRLRKPLSLLLAALFLALQAAPAAALGVGQIGGALSGDAIDIPGVAAGCAGGSCGEAVSSCGGGGGGPLASLFAGSCGGGGGGGFLQGIAGFFKRLFGGILEAIRNLFGGIFGGGSNDGGGCTGGGCNGGGGGYTPPGDGGSAPPTSGGDDRGITPPVGPPADNGTGTTAPPAPPADLGDLAKKAGIISYPATQNYTRSSSSMLNDVESHIATKHGGQYRDSDPATWTHETTHGINSDIRNGVAIKTFGNHKVNGFYLGDGQAFIMQEFRNMRLGDAIPFIPQGLRGSRFDLYLVRQQQGWGDTPSYIFDEWVAYTNGGKTSVELGKQGQLRQHSDAVKGALEFTIYSLALGMAVERKSPQQLDDRMKAFMALQMRRAMQVFHDGQKIANLQGFGQQEMLQRFISGPDAEAMRAFVKRHWGEAFFNEVFLPR